MDQWRADLSSCARCNIPDVVAPQTAAGEKPTPIGGEHNKCYSAARGVFEYMEGLEGIGVPELEACSIILESGARDHIAHGGPCTLCSAAGISNHGSFEHLGHVSVKVPDCQVATT